VLHAGHAHRGTGREAKNAGLYAYNHNLDTSEEFYGEIISTRTYDNRLETIEHVRKSGISVCSGGIIGLGESENDRIGMLHVLANLPEHPSRCPSTPWCPWKARRWKTRNAFRCGKWCG
jgi:biotin synthase